MAIWCGILVEHVSLLGGGSIHLGILALPLTFVWIIGITNAFNLVDGLDGLAAGLTIIAAGSIATIFFLRGDAQDALLLLILLGALLGFLPYNFNPATIFLGDSGSLVVGYILAVTAITGSQKGATTLAVMIPLLVFGLPIVDTLLAMVRRCVGSLRMLNAPKATLREQIRVAKSMFEADQKHIHHRLIALGFSHRNAVLVLYALALGLSSLALLSVLAHYRNAGIILIAIGLATYIGIRKLGYDEIAFLRTGTLLRWYESLTFNRRFFLGFIDMTLITAAYWGAFVLHYDLPWRHRTQSLVHRDLPPRPRCAVSLPVRARALPWSMAGGGNLRSYPRSCSRTPGCHCIIYSRHGEPATSGDAQILPPRCSAPQRLDGRNTEYVSCPGLHAATCTRHWRANAHLRCWTGWAARPA